MIQVHGNTILSMKFKSIIKAHGLNPWQFIYQKSNSHWQHQKAQFLLVTSKPSSRWQHQKTQFLLATSKAQFSLATSKSQAQFSLAISKAQFTLAPLKTQAIYLARFYQKPKVINTWQNTIS